MTTLSASNMNINMNMNMNMGAGLGLPSVAPGQVRFNTADFRKLVPNPPPPLAMTPPPKFPENWDPDLRSYIYLNEFLLANTGWFTTLNSALGSTRPTDSGVVDTQLGLVLDASPDREDRFAEIIQQHDAEGAIGYFLGMLMIDPARHPNTYLLIRVARRIGEHVTMVLKGSQIPMIQRPSQLCPAIVPMIDPPVTPSFPAGHALEAWLIAKCLGEAWAKQPGQALRTTLLSYLADRLGENRVIAGVHYPLDVSAGKNAALACFTLMNTPISGSTFAAGSRFRDLVVLATGESL
jgi:membrane-associated phospholipid phosphatase